jgi:hypothetical protein
MQTYRATGGQAFSILAIGLAAARGGCAAVGAGLRRPVSGHEEPEENANDERN